MRKPEHPLILTAISMGAPLLVVFFFAGVAFGLASCIEPGGSKTHEVCRDNLVYFEDRLGNCFASCSWNHGHLAGQGLTTVPCDKMPPPPRLVPGPVLK